MNVNYLSSQTLQCTYPQVNIDYYAYLGQVNTLGVVTVSYAPPITFLANVQMADKQKLKEVAGYSANTIYKSFWIDNESITGLNRNIATGGDYIIYNNLKYKIVGIENDYNTDWIVVFGAEGVIDE